MYILQGAYKTHLKNEHEIGDVLRRPKVKTESPPLAKSRKTSKLEMACEFCLKKYYSANLLEKHRKVHGKPLFVTRFFELN